MVSDSRWDRPWCHFYWKCRTQTLLLRCDNPFSGSIVIGATNFSKSLDSALLRPGRFDKHVSVPLPDVGGRKEILDMYAAKTKVAEDVDLGILPRGTTACPIGNDR